MRNFKDESFIRQFLSPQLIRDLRLFSVLDDDEQDELEISAIHDDMVIDIFVLHLPNNTICPCASPTYKFTMWIYGAIVR